MSFVRKLVSQRSTEAQEAFEVPEDEFGRMYIIVANDAFTRFVELEAAIESERCSRICA